MVQKALELEFDFLAVTDHVGIQEGPCTAIAECLAETRLVCMPGAELTSGTIHLLALGVQRRISPYQPLADQVAEVHREGGLAIAAHPFDETFKYTIDDLRSTGLDGMECGVGNEQVDQQQWQLASSFNLPCIYTSDAHKRKDLGKRYAACSVPINSLAGLIGIGGERVQDEPALHKVRWGWPPKRRPFCSLAARKDGHSGSQTALALQAILADGTFRRGDNVYQVSSRAPRLGSFELASNIT